MAAQYTLTHKMYAHRDTQVLVSAQKRLCTIIQNVKVQIKKFNRTVNVLLKQPVVKIMSNRLLECDYSILLLSTYMQTNYLCVYTCSSVGMCVQWCVGLTVGAPSISSMIRQFGRLSTKDSACICVAASMLRLNTSGLRSSLQNNIQFYIHTPTHTHTHTHAYAHTHAYTHVHTHTHT